MLLKLQIENQARQNNVNWLPLNLPKLINGTSITPIVIENDENNKLELIHEKTKTMLK
jgi:hypothetical protein